VDHVRLGNSGLRMSRICLGMMSYGDPAVGDDWVLDEDAARPFVRQAAEAGITFFDTSNNYSSGTSEEVTGRLLRETFARREDYVLATKVFHRTGSGPNDAGLSRAHVLDACDASLRRLGVDHIDLYQIHRFDPHTPVEETMEALDHLVRAGKVRYLGASSMWAWQLAKAQHAAEVGGWTRFASYQSHYNLLYREEEREMLPLLRDQGLGCLPWSPLARGLLARAGSEAGATVRATSDDNIGRYVDASPTVLDRVAEVASRRAVSPATVAIAWLLRNPGVTAPLVGATKPGQLDASLAALDLTLTDDEAVYLEEPYRPLPVLGHR
jgi:1-deoxyxylulose-5-phosphate synthase